MTLAMSDTKPRIFIAYPSKPLHVAETLRTAINGLADASDFTVQPWTSLKPNGRPILNSITSAIDQSNVFAADLTLLNHNVLFELGYAIGLGRPIWLTLNESEPDAVSLFSRFALVRSLGYSVYVNSYGYESAFYADTPWTMEPATSLIRLFDSPIKSSRHPSLLYLKSPIETDTSINLTSSLRDAPLFKNALIIDDPAEAPQDQLVWFVNHVRSSEAIVAHFMREDAEQAQWHNAKCALVCGIALSHSKPLLMIANRPFSTPFDYRELLYEVDTAERAKSITAKWLESIESEIRSRWDNVQANKTSVRRVTELQYIRLGEPIAENEKDDLEDVFIPTSAYRSLISGRQNFFVGRKGTGKTANLYRAANELQSDKRNLVVTLKPATYDIESLVEHLPALIQRSERSFLAESVWKLIILSEIALMLREQQSSRPSFILASPEESALNAYMSRHESLFLSSYAERLDYAINQSPFVISHNPPSPDKISETLHSSFIPDLLNLTRPLIGGYSRLVMLVDNLDKTWHGNVDVGIISEVIFGLLGISGRIEDDFRSPRRDGAHVSVSLTVFLRSDIYRSIQQLARERDKLSYERIEWDDRELLASVIDKRLQVALGDKDSIESLWTRIAIATVQGISTRDYLSRSVLPRPRDLIYLVQAAINRAGDRSHDKIQESDIRSALEEYSEYALRSLYAEGDPSLESLEGVLLEFAGSDARLTSDQVRDLIVRSGVAESGVSDYINLLCDLNFLGILTQSNDYEYVRDESRRNILLRAANNRQRQPRNKRRKRSSVPVLMYKVNPVFHHALEVSG